MPYRRICSISVFLLLLLVSPLQSTELKEWPRSVAVSSGSITIYQPQIESLENNIMKGSAAVAYFAEGKKDPVFGVAWFDSKVQIDRDRRIVQYETLEITNTRFPEENTKLAKEFRQAVSDGMKTWELESSLDDLTTALAAIKQEKTEAANLKNDPPDIIYMDKPALLITIDGKAVLQKIEGNSDYQAVANTPYPLFNKNKSGSWYLNGAENVWYQAKDVDGPWTFDTDPPQSLVKMVQDKAKEYDQEEDSSETKITTENNPEIVVVHKPTELIVSDGKAGFEPLTDDLLVMNNTDSRVFMDVKSQKYFIVASGRWYQADSMQGKWHFVTSDKLPGSFTKIPRNSKYSDVRSYVADTDEAKEAVMDAQIPQTAAIKRGTVDIKVQYDGKPKFKEIEKTDLQYAVNSSETVLKSGKEYYLVKDGVWYISDSPNGPWKVSDHAAPGIGKVPPSSPVYNTKYVYVYDSTPEVVYVGYTPGYVGSYIYGPTIVYGTGYYYSPWITPHYYYPRPATWGFSVSYNPWSGWGFGMSWSSGPFRFGFYTGGGYHGHGWGHRYWGPRGYRRSYNNINIHNTNINVNRNNWDSVTRNNNIYRSSNQRANIVNSVDSRSISSTDRQNIQNRIDNRAAVRPAVSGHNPASKINSGELSTADIRNKAATRDNLNRVNNVLADKDGNVLRNHEGQWQQRTGGEWQNKNIAKVDEVKRSSVPKTSGYDRSSSIDRQQYSRQRSTERMHSARSSMGGGSRAGGRRGGGGGGRGGGRR